MIKENLEVDTLEILDEDSDVFDEEAICEIEKGLGLEPEPEPKDDKSKPKPPTEVQLDTLQEKYLTTRDEGIWQEMFLVCVPYAKSLILKKIKSKVFLDPEYVNECAVSVALRFLGQYKTNPTFKVDWSFAGMMNYKVLEVLYGHKNEDDHVSLNHYMSGDSKGELGDYLNRIGYQNVLNPNEAQFYDPEALSHRVEVIQNVKEILSELDASIPDNYKLQLLARLRVLMMFRYPRSRHVDSVFKRNFTNDFREECILDRTLLEVRNRLKGVESTG